MSPLQFTVPAKPASAASDCGFHAAPASGFLQRPFVQNVLPFITSLSLHVALVVIGLLTYTAIQIIHQPLQNQVTPTDFSMAADAGMPKFAGEISDRESRQALQNLMPNDDMRGVSFRAAASPALAGGAEGGSDSLIAVGMTGISGGKSVGIGRDSGEPGNSDGLLAHWGMAPQLGVGGPVFVSNPGARKVTFLCDSSGSMINKMASLKMELAKAVDKLRISQSFSIVFFSAGRPAMISPALLPATPQNKRKASEFLDGITATGTTEPIPGLEAAFQQHPELIYLLTDGDFPDNNEVLARIRKLNEGKKVRIHTIAFVGSGDSDVAFIDLLKTVAKENGGTYRHVNEEELQ